MTGNLVRVDGVHVGLAQVGKERPGDHHVLPGHREGQRLGEDQAFQPTKGLDELGAQFRVGKVRQNLQFLFVRARADHAHAVPFLRREQVVDGQPDLVLGLLRVGVGADAKGVVEVGRRVRRLPIVVHDLKGEVARNPEEPREAVGEAPALVVRRDVDVLRNGRDQREVVQGCLVDGTRRVVQEHGTQEEGQREDAGVVVRGRAQRAKALRIYHQNVVVPLGQRRPHDPEPFRARFDGRRDLEGRLLLGVQDAVQKVRLPRSIEANDGHDRQGACQGLQVRRGFREDVVLVGRLVEADPLDGPCHV